MYSILEHYAYQISQSLMPGAIGHRKVRVWGITIFRAWASLAGCYQPDGISLAGS